jgi:hypothetical protein
MHALTALEVSFTAKESPWLLRRQLLVHWAVSRKAAVIGRGSAMTLTFLASSLQQRSVALKIKA